MSSPDRTHLLEPRSVEPQASSSPSPAALTGDPSQIGPHSSHHYSALTFYASPETKHLLQHPSDPVRVRLPTAPASLKGVFRSFSASAVGDSRPILPRRRSISSSAQLRSRRASYQSTASSVCRSPLSCTPLSIRKTRRSTSASKAPQHLSHSHHPSAGQLIESLPHSASPKRDTRWSISRANAPIRLPTPNRYSSSSKALKSTELLQCGEQQSLGNRPNSNSDLRALQSCQPHPLHLTSNFNQQDSYSHRRALPVPSLSPSVSGSFTCLDITGQEDLSQSINKHVTVHKASVRPRPPLSRSASAGSREGLRGILLRRSTNNSQIHPTPPRPTTSRSVSAASHRELLFSRKHFFSANNCHSSYVPTTAASRHPSLSRSISLDDHRDFRIIRSISQEPLFVDIERVDFDLVFPDTLNTPAHLLYHSREERPHLGYHKTPAFVPSFIVAPMSAMSNRLATKEGHTESGHVPELSIESVDSGCAVNGGSADEEAIPNTASPARSARIVLVPSKRHTLQLPLILNSPRPSPPVSPSYPTERASKPRPNIFQRLKIKFFKHWVQHLEGHPSAKATGISRSPKSREMPRSASKMSLNVIFRRHRGKGESIPAFSTTKLSSPLRRSQSIASEEPEAMTSNGPADPVNVECLCPSTPLSIDFTTLRLIDPTSLPSSIHSIPSVVPPSSEKPELPLSDPANYAATIEDGRAIESMEAIPTKALTPEQQTRRRHRMTVMAGSQTYVDGELVEPLNWKWEGGDSDSDLESGGDGWCASKSDGGSRRTSVGGAAESLSAITDTLARLTSVIPVDIPVQRDAQPDAEQILDQTRVQPMHNLRNMRGFGPDEDLVTEILNINELQVHLTRMDIAPITINETNELRGSNVQESAPDDPTRRAGSIHTNGAPRAGLSMLSGPQNPASSSAGKRGTTPTGPDALS